VEVVAAVILKADGQFLLAQRPAGKVYAGWWEFPGGKVEPGEAPADALARELHEELGIDVTRAWPWISREYVYAHAHVRLNFFRVLEWEGEPRSREAQALSWQRTREIKVGPVLPANGPILRSLALPPVLAITDASERGESALLERLDSALSRGLRMVMVREKQMPRERQLAFIADVLQRCRRAGALTVVNGDEELACVSGADGLHLTSAQLLQRQQRPDLPWCGASCHDHQELARASALGLDYVVLGPVLRTPSHPHARPMGWRRFEERARASPLPVYALGGMSLHDFATAGAAGAHGLAMVRSAWSGAPDQSFPSDWSGSASVVGTR
jgi:8-oxo-dGTP diphosphatase